MAISCPVDLDTRKLRDEIRSIYARVAVEPSGEFHFHRGPDYAAELLRYDRAALAELPDESAASFAGVANPHRMGPSAKEPLSSTSAAAPAWTCCWPPRASARAAAPSPGTSPVIRPTMAVPLLVRAGSPKPRSHPCPPLRFAFRTQAAAARSPSPLLIAS